MDLWRAGVPWCSNFMFSISLFPACTGCASAQFVAAIKQRGHGSPFGQCLWQFLPWHLVSVSSQEPALFKRPLLPRSLPHIFFNKAKRALYHLNELQSGQKGHPGLLALVIVSLPGQHFPSGLITSKCSQMLWRNLEGGGGMKERWKRETQSRRSPECLSKNIDFFDTQTGNVRAPKSSLWTASPSATWQAMKDIPQQTKKKSNKMFKVYYSSVG